MNDICPQPPRPRRRPLLARAFVGLFTLTAPLGCSDAVETSLINEADLCLSQKDAGIEILVDARTCLSSCDKDRKAECSATVDGDRITVVSELRWTTDPDDPCTADCQAINARCTIADLPDGEYTVVHGDQTRTITVPIQGGCVEGQLGGGSETGGPPSGGSETGGSESTGS